MMTKDEALKMAIEAMNSAYSSHGKILTSMPAQDAWLYHGCDAKLFKALQACKEALEQPAQEPVYIVGKGWNCDEMPAEGTKLYTHPAPSWQGLSDDERFIIVQNADWDNPYDIAELIEQALKTKNGKV